MKLLLPAILMISVATPAAPQEVIRELNPDRSQILNRCGQNSTDNLSISDIDNVLRVGCIADGAIVSTMSSDSISVSEFGGSISASGPVNRDAFNAAIDKVSVRGGRIVLPGVGNYNVSPPLSTTKRIIWDAPQGATVNGSSSPHILGRWRNGPEEIEFTKGSGTEVDFTIGPGSFRQILEPGAIGHFEAAHIEADASKNGSIGKFIVGIQGIGRTDSSGNVIGIGGYAHARSNALASAEVSGGEFNTDVQALVVTRKTGLQLVDTSSSIGYGSFLDAGLFIGRQSGGTGYGNGIQFGDGVDAHFPLKNAEGNALLSIKGGSNILVGYGFNAGHIRYAKSALALHSQVPGHRISWGVGDTDNQEGGEIRSDANIKSGKIIFTDGGLFAQSSNGTPAVTIQDSGAILRRPVHLLVSGKSYTSTAKDYLIVVRKVITSPTSIVLPISPPRGGEVIIKDGKGDASTNNIIISGGIIDGDTKIIINNNYGVVRLIFDGVQWLLI